MGWWFSNVHVRKNETADEAALVRVLNDFMAERGLVPTDDAAEADSAIAVLSGAHPWFTLCAEELSFQAPEQFREFGLRFSEALKTDVLGIVCLDSDYLYLNLINTTDNTDAWADVGIFPIPDFDLGRQTELSAWENKVAQFNVFCKSVEKDYVCAEDFLDDVAPCLELPAPYNKADAADLEELGLKETAKKLYYRRPPKKAADELPRLASYMYSLMPCRDGEVSSVNAINVGGAGKGIAVYFLGPYVEHDEITFSNVCFFRHKDNEGERVPITLGKTQLTDGQWAYYYHDADFVIPEKIDERLPPRKRAKLEPERAICVCFVPHGNTRQMLDVTVVLVPDENPTAQFAWNVWRKYCNSKREFIAEHNQKWNKHAAQMPVGALDKVLLREEDYVLE